MEGVVRGDYKIIREVGSGAMGTVYLAEHKDLPDLKVIFKQMSDPAFFNRFKDEANSMALLEKHPNICRIRDFFNDGDSTLIAMEYIDGPTLSTILKKKKQIEPDEALRIMIDVLDALQFAHSKTIHHRDIKPGNIMIETSDQRVKVIDFGIAKTFESLHTEQTLAGHIVGTPEFMAPEQFDRNAKVNFAVADIYACAVTLYLMLTGKLPFEGSQMYDLLHSKIEVRPTVPSQLVKGIDSRLDVVIMNCLHPDPQMRVQSAAHFRDKLMGIRGSYGQVESKKAPPTKKKKSSAQGGQGGGLKVVMTLIVLLVLGGGGYWAYSQGYFDSLFSSSGASEAPGAPLLIAPLSGQQFSPADELVLVWETAKDRFSTYELEIDRTQSFDSPQLYAPPPTGKFNVPGNLEPGTYYWRVRTRGNNGVAGEYSDARSFTLIMPENGGPDEPVTEPVEIPVVITTNVPSRIIVQGQVVAESATEYEGTLEAGQYSVRAENSVSQERTLEQNLTTVEGKDARLNFEFTSITKASVRISSEPSGASVIVDGRIRPGVTTPTTLELEPGRYRVEVELDGQIREKAVTLQNGQSEQLSFDFFVQLEQEYATSLNELQAVIDRVPDDERSSQLYASAGQSIEEARTFANNHDYKSAMSSLNTIDAQIRQLMLQRFDDSTRMVSTVTGYWDALKAREIDKMEQAYPSGDHNGYRRMAELSDSLIVIQKLHEVTLNRSAGQGTVVIDVRTIFGGKRLGEHQVDQRWEFKLERSKTNWLIDEARALQTE